LFHLKTQAILNKLDTTAMLTDQYMMVLVSTVLRYSL
jgi:hypothetical protein